MTDDAREPEPGFTSMEALAILNDTPMPARSRGAAGCARCAELERALDRTSRAIREHYEPRSTTLARLEVAADAGTFTALIEAADGWLDDASVCWSEEATAADRAVLDRARRALEAAGWIPRGGTMSDEPIGGPEAER